MSLSRLAALGLSLVLPAALAAGAPAGAAVTAIVHGKVYPISGPPIEDGTVVLTDGRITAVGRNLAIPPGAELYDAAGKVVTPGLLDGSTRLGLVEVGAVEETRDDAYEVADPIRAAFRVTDAVNPLSTLIPVTRIEGVTTAVTAPSGGLVAGQGAVIDLWGGSIGAMLVKDPAAMYATFDAPEKETAGGSRGGVALLLREAFDDARWLAAHRDAYDANRSRPLAESRLDLEALARVLAGEMPLVVEADRASDISAVVRIAHELGVRLIVSGGAEAWLVAGDLAAAHVPVLVGPLDDLPGSFSRIHSSFENAARLGRAGVDVAIVSGDSHNSRNLTWQAGEAVAYGLPWDAALAAVTLVPARLFGVDRDHGSLAPGKVADVVVWSGDPLDFSGWAEAVWIRGHRVPMTSRQEQLFQRYETLGGEPPEYKH